MDLNGSSIPYSYLGLPNIQNDKGTKIVGPNTISKGTWGDVANLQRLIIKPD